MLFRDPIPDICIYGYRFMKIKEFRIILAILLLIFLWGITKQCVMHFCRKWRKITRNVLIIFESVVLCISFSLSAVVSFIPIQLVYLPRLYLASANRIAALTSRDGILWVQGIPDVKKRYRESIEIAYYRLNKGCQRDKFVIRSVTDVLRTQSRFVKCVGVRPAASPPPPPQILQTYFGPEVRQKQTL